MFENEKIQEENREKTRDILRRIRGLDKVIRFVAIPKPISCSRGGANVEP
jgi:hypothetical protein